MYRKQKKTPSEKILLMHHKNVLSLHRDGKLVT